MSRCMNCSSPIKRVNTRSQNIFGIMHWQLPLVSCFPAVTFERCLNTSLFFFVVMRRAKLKLFKRTAKIFYVYPIVSPLFHGLNCNPLLIVGIN
jgi:hypothetical protein